VALCFAAPRSWVMTREPRPFEVDVGVRVP